LKRSTYSGISPTALLQLLRNSERLKKPMKKYVPAQMKCDLKVIVAALMYGTTMKQSQHKNPWPQK